MRQRLSWDKEAEMKKKADPYTMNQDHTNNPIEKYRSGDPSAWAEDQDMKTPWKGEGRSEVGLPAPERAAVMAARKLEDKALKCITIAQRMLPGANDESIEAQATALMYMPEHCVLATLTRQADLAEVLSGKDEDEDEDDKEAGKKAPVEDEDDDKEAGKKAPVEDEDEKDAAKKVPVEDEDEKDAAKKVPVEDEKDAAKKKVEPEEKEVSSAKKVEDEDEKGAAKKAPVEDEDEKDAAKKVPVEDDKEAGKKAPVEDEDEKDAAKKVPVEDKKDDEDVDASIDLLDQIFASEATVKTGAKKLSGLVKQASNDSMSLDSLWSAPPDVSKAFSTGRY